MGKIVTPNIRTFNYLRKIVNFSAEMGYTNVSEEYEHFMKLRATEFSLLGIKEKSNAPKALAIDLEHVWQ